MCPLSEIQFGLRARSYVLSRQDKASCTERQPALEPLSNRSLNLEMCLKFTQTH